MLGNARSRQLYELSLSDVASSYVKQAAAAQADGDRYRASIHMCRLAYAYIFWLW